MTFRLLCFLAILAICPPAAAQDGPHATPAPGAATRAATPDTSSAATVPAPAGGNVPEKYIKEMYGVYNACAADEVQSLLNDCRCLAVKFLDARRAAGDETNRDLLIAGLGNVCPNQESMAGYIYDDCLDGLAFQNVKDYDLVCACLANKVAVGFSKLAVVNSLTMITLRRDSLIACEKENDDRQRAKSPRKNYLAR